MIALIRPIMKGMLAGLLLCFPAAQMVGQALEPEPASPSPPAVKPVPPLRAFPTPAVPPTVRTRPASQYPPPQRTVVRPATTPAYPGTPPNALVWENELVQLTAPPDASNILVTFSFTNVHTSEVVIKNVFKATNNGGMLALLESELQPPHPLIHPKSYDEQGRYISG